MATPELRALEAAFHARVSRSLAARGAEPLPDALLSVVGGDARASARERLAIYERMYFHRLHDILAGDSPRLADVLGAQAFGELVADYLLASPPNHPSVRNAGARLGAFVEGHPLGLGRAWLADLARLERARIEVFDAADSVILDLASLRALAPERFASLPLRFVAAHGILAIDSRALSAWRGEVGGENASRVDVIVWRGRDWMTVHHRSLSASERELASLLVCGTTFGAICGRLADQMSDEAAAQTGAQCLARWVDDGLVT